MPPDPTKAAAEAARLALATAGLTSCVGSCAVDPAPPPFECTSDIQSGANLEVQSTELDGTALRVVLATLGYADGSWSELEVTDLDGATTASVTPDPAEGPVRTYEELTIELEVAATLPVSGTFVLRGSIDGAPDGPCAVERTFTFTADGVTDPVVAQRQKLPLEARERARIRVVRRDARRLHLACETAFAGPVAVSWEVTGGRLCAVDGSTAEWELPDADGLYQVEVVADYGTHGMAFDALPLEVARSG